MSTTNPSEPTNTASAFARALRAPLGELFLSVIRPQHRSGRGPENILREADLPQSLTAAIASILRRTRLWRGERADVAAELASHFRDGLDAGRTAEQLLGDFGSIPHAAKLIRRAKRRGRSLAWRTYAAVWSAIGWGLLAFLALYVFFFVRYMMLKPSIARNYLAEMNAPIRAIPEADRAWPLYRRAYLALAPVVESGPPAWEIPVDGAPARLVDTLGAWDVPPESLALARTYIEQNQPALDLARAAAARPAFGAEVSNAFDIEMTRHAQLLGGMPETDLSHYNSTPDPEASLLQITANEAESVSFLARILATDARLAADDGDADRAVADILSMFGMARHFRERVWLVGDLVAMSMQSLALDTTNHLITAHPDLLTDQQMTRLAHAAATIGNGSNAEIVRFDAERVQFDDVLQRVYSDDGDGNGVLTRAGFVELERMTADFGVAAQLRLRQTGLELAVGPVAAAVVADRASTHALFNSFIDAIEDRTRVPLWERDHADNVNHLIHNFYENELAKARYPVVAMMAPALEQATRAGERLLLRRDTTLILLAVEMHRRRAGSYPATLADIAPTLLPITPIDRLTGQPLCYIVREGRPIIYSRGADQDDDRARPVDPNHPRFRIQSRGQDNHIGALINGRGSEPDFDGDWTLWPPAPPESAAQ